MLCPQEVEPSCAAQLCSMWSNCEDPDNHIPIIPARNRPSESTTRYPLQVTSLFHQVTSSLRRHQVAFRPAATCLPGLNSSSQNLWRFYAYLIPALLLRTSFTFFQDPVNSRDNKIATQPKYYRNYFMNIDILAVKTLVI